MRDIFEKGAKYRVPKLVDREEVEHASTTAIVNYTQYLIRKKIISSEQAIRMQERFMQIARSRIAKRLNQGHGVRMVDEAHLRTELHKVHSKFVICPADKASNNYVVVCKVLYLTILCEELGVTCEHGRLVGKGNSTYAFVGEEVVDILARHARIAQGYGLTVSEKDSKLPHMFAIPKLHKSPYGWRFIAGARKSSTRALSLRLHVILSSFKRHFRNYCKVIEARTGHSYFWSVDNSIVVKDRLVASFAGKNLNSFISADFSTLFTALPHKTIERCLFALTDKCFNNSGKPYVCVEKGKVFFVEDSQKHAGECYRREQVKQLITDVIGQTYVQFAGLTLRQVCGVPMGNNSSSDIADLTLSYLEFEYLSTHCKDSIWAKRFIDDLLIANYRDFMQIASTIYSPELPLKRTNKYLDKVDFLDLAIRLINSKPVTSVYNKTDDFSFKVSKYGYVDSNVHSNVGLCVFFSQMIRFGRISDEISNFEAKLSEMFAEFLEHGFQREKLICKFFSVCK